MGSGGSRHILASPFRRSERSVGKAVSADELQQRVTEQVRVAAFVVPERHLMDEFYREEPPLEKEALAFQSTGTADSEASRL